MTYTSQVKIDKRIYDNNDFGLTDELIYRDIINKLIYDVPFSQLNRTMRFELFSLNPDTCDYLIFEPHEFDYYMNLISKLRHDYEILFEVKLILD